MQQNSLKCNKIPLIVHILKEISDFSTSVIRRNLKLIHMGMNFRLLHICHVQEFEISPHDRFFLHGHRPWVRDKYEVCADSLLTLYFLSADSILTSAGPVLTSTDYALTITSSNTSAGILLIETGRAQNCIKNQCEQCGHNQKHKYLLNKSNCIRIKF